MLVLFFRYCYMRGILNCAPEVLVEDEFIIDLFQLIEQLSSDVNDPYHYPIIKVLVSIVALLRFIKANEIYLAGPE